MNAYSRVSSGLSIPSSPNSPSRSSRLRHVSSRSKAGQRSRQPEHRWLFQLFAWGLLSIVLRRQGIFLFAPFIYIPGMILYMGTVSFDVVVPEVITRPPPGFVYRSPQLYEKLRRDMDADNSSDGIETVWRHPYKGGEWRPCIYKSLGEGEPRRNGNVTPL